MPLHRLLPFVAALFVVAPAAAQVAEPLPVDQAFRLTIQPGPAGSRTTASFEIADGYYLYGDKIAVETRPPRRLRSACRRASARTIRPSAPSRSTIGPCPPG